MAKKFRGLTDELEKKQSQYRDPRSGFTRLRESLEKPSNVLAVFVGLGAGTVVVPFVPAFVWILVVAWFAWRSMTRQSPYPLRMPRPENRPDYNSPPPGRDNGATPAKGIAYLGTDIVTGKQIWLTDSDLRQHLFYIATTGGGKSEALISLVANAFAWGSGFCFIDGKADTGLYGKIYAMARRFGREDDIRVINYLSGGKDDNISSNTMNPIATGSSRMIQSLLESLMDSAGGSGGDMWKGRAIVLMNAVVRALVALRDENGFSLDVVSLRDYMGLDKVMDLAARTDLPKMALLGLRGYLSSLPGFRMGIPYEKQQPQTLEQHGFLQMQFTRTLGDFAETYGKIFGSRISDVDMEDVVINRRILIVMLPALELSGDGLRQTGKIVVANLKAMMARCLGNEIEGDHADVFEGKPSTCETPFMIIQDECGYYLPDDAPVMAAQARSLGISLTYATQEIASLKSSLKDKADQIVGNTSTKLFGKIEDPNETMKYVMERAAHGNALAGKNFVTDHGIGLDSFRSEKQVQLERTERVDKRDLYNQREGEYHMFFYDRIFRMRAFFANPPSVKRYTINKMIAISPPSEEEMRILEDRVDTVSAVIRDPGALSRSYPAAPELKMVAHLFRSKELRLGWSERAAAAVAAIGFFEEGAEVPPQFRTKEGEAAVPVETDEVLDGAEALAQAADASKGPAEASSGSAPDAVPSGDPRSQNKRFLRRVIAQAREAERQRGGQKPVDPAKPADVPEAAPLQPPEAAGGEEQSGDNGTSGLSVLQRMAQAGGDDMHGAWPEEDEAGETPRTPETSAPQVPADVGQAPKASENDDAEEVVAPYPSLSDPVDYDGIGRVATEIAASRGVPADQAAADAAESVRRLRAAHAYPKDPIPKRAKSNARVVDALKRIRTRVIDAAGSDGSRES